MHHHGWHHGCSAVLFYFYPGVTEQIMGVFQCQTIDVSDAPYSLFARTSVSGSMRQASDGR